MRTKHLASVLLPLLLLSRAVAALPDQVGDFSDPGRLVFKGDSPFSEAEMRRAVASDLELAVAGAPSAAFDKYIQRLQDRLLDGFYASGFYRPSVQVHADADTGSIVVTLDLGRRWKCGKVIVDGAKTLAVDELIKRLTEPSAPTLFDTTVSDSEISVNSNPGPDPAKLTDAVWTRGKWASFDSFRAASLLSEVRLQLARMGYLHPFLRIGVEPGDTDVNLNIHLIDEGPRATLHKLKFETLSRNDPADVQAFLKVTANEPVNLDRMCDLQRQLWESGRFTQHTILVERISDDPEHVNLRVKIKEADKVPLLTEPLSEVDQAMLRLGKWFSNAGEDGTDLALSYHAPKSPGLDLVWGGPRGLAARVDLSNVTSRTVAGLLGDDGILSVQLTKTISGCYLPIAGLKWEGKCDPSLILASLGLSPNPDENSEHPVNFNLSGRVDTEHVAPPGGGMHTRRWFAPVVFLSRGMGRGTATIEGPNVVFRQSRFTLRADSASGKMIDATVEGDANSGHFVLSARPGLLVEMQKSLVGLACGNVSVPDHPYASAMAFLLSGVCHSGLVNSGRTPEATSKLTRVVRRVVNDKLLLDAGDILQSLIPSSDDSDSFDLPVDTNFDQPSGLSAMIANAGLHLNVRLFQSRSWPATAVRCACMHLAGHDEVLPPELNRIYADQATGPLACLVMAEWTNSVNPSAGRPFARLGLDRLNAKRFAGDCRQLFDGKPQTKALTAELCDNLRHLSDADLAELITQLPPSASAGLRAVIDQLRSTPGPLTADQIESAFEKFWSPELAASMKNELQRLAD